MDQRNFCELYNEALDEIVKLKARLRMTQVTTNDKPSELPDTISEKEALGLMINLMKDLQAENEKLEAALELLKKKMAHK